MMSDNYWIVAARPNDEDMADWFVKDGIWATNKHLDTHDGSHAASVGKSLDGIEKGDTLVMVKSRKGLKEVLVRAVGDVKEIIDPKIKDNINEKIGDCYKAKVDWGRVNGEEGEVVEFGGFESTIRPLDRNRENHKPLIDFVEKWLKENP